MNEARNNIARPVPLDYLGQSVPNRHHVAGWRRRHVAVRERVFKYRIDPRKLTSEIVGQAALFGFDARA